MVVKGDRRGGDALRRIEEPQQGKSRRGSEGHPALWRVRRMQLPGGSTRIPPARAPASSVRSVIINSNNIYSTRSSNNISIKSCNESTTINDSECVCGSIIGNSNSTDKSSNNNDKKIKKNNNKNETCKGSRKNCSDKNLNGRRSGVAGRFYRRSENADKERNGSIGNGRKSRAVKERHHLVAATTRTNRRHRVTKHPQVLLASAPRRKVRGEE
ncbi:nuclear transcription factor Y subunit gamma-like isoform X1 [Vespula pensylvanica]|uniref:nuclear transcription factor Y subunit gamma-like isoform X1 n=2 Tax=Vespula pensylvanica TaxID=30213 RepID=UPI001CB9FC83|nr:nuclear transcription factor Y subunit gamma-like isoform X1 [Vespula pensylvanica]